MMLSILAGCFIGSFAQELDLDLHEVSITDGKFIKALAKEINEKFTHPQAEGYDKDCKECVMTTAKWLNSHAMAKVAEKCATPHSCPQQKAFCELYHVRPRIAEGMLMFWIHPIMISGAFCTGKGVCHPNDQFADVEHHLMIEGLDADLDLEEQMPEEVHNNIRQDVMAITQFEAEQAGAVNDPHPPSHKCIQKVTPHIMLEAMKKVRAHCLTTKSASMKKKCEWVKEHKQLSLGYLLALVEPWKFAYGYCIPHRQEPTKPIFV